MYTFQSLLLGVSFISWVSAPGDMIEYRRGAHFCTQIFGENYAEFAESVKRYIQNLNDEEAKTRPP